MAPPEARSQGRRNVLGLRADRHALHMAVLAEVLIVKIDDCSGDRETQTLAAAAFGQDERVDANKIAINIHERTAAISGIDRRIGLDINHRIVGIGLAAD